MVNFIKAIVNYIFLNGRSHSKGISFYKEQPENIVIEVDKDKNHYIGAYLLNGNIQINENTKFFVVCHGKGTDRHDATGHSKLKTQSNKNAVFLMIDYSGFGESTVDFSKENANKDMHAAFEFMKAKYKNSKEIFAIGHSYGTAVVLAYTDHAKENGKSIQPGKIFLFAPFEELSPLLWGFNKFLSFLFYIPGLESLLFSELEYNNGEVVDKHQEKIVIFHGKKDQMIPFEHSQRMAERSRKAKVFFTEDSHDAVFENLENWNVLFKEANVD